MVRRRAFVSGMLAAGLLPAPSWSDAGDPAFLSAARKPDGRFALFGLSGQGRIAFECPLPARGHAAAAHPQRPEAVAFARRPGTYAIVLDCVTGRSIAQIEAPDGRHFYGHGAFSSDGSHLYTTENAFEAGQGIVGVWDARNAYKRIGEFSSGGVGPHDIKLMPDGETLVIANGGIETHPDTGRSKLNLPTMRSSLSYLSLDGTLVDEVILGSQHQRNSIRHIAVAQDGSVGFAMQWQGDLSVDLPLLGLHNRARATLHLFEDASIRALDGYLGSVALSSDGTQLAATSPRSGSLLVASPNSPTHTVDLPDVCGIAATQAGITATTGEGWVVLADGSKTSHKFAWDNHLVAIAS